MNWFKDFFSSGVDKVVDSVGGAIDRLVTSDEEKLLVKLEMQKEFNRLKSEAMDKQAEFDREITARWKSDNEHSITRLVRPVSFISVLAVFGVIIFLDGNIGEFKINPSYIPVIEGLLYTMVIAYFGSRGSEKIVRTIKGAEK